MDLRQTFWQVHGGQTGTFIKSIRFYSLHICRDRDIGQAAAAVKGPQFDLAQTRRKINGTQAAAFGKAIQADTGDRVGQRYLFQLGTAAKRIHADTGHRVGDHDTGKAGTVLKGQCVDTGDFDFSQGGRNCHLSTRALVFGNDRLPCFYIILPNQIIQI